MDTCEEAAVAVLVACFGESAVVVSHAGWVAGSLGGEMEALENEWRREDELVGIGVEVGSPAKGVLGGGGGMLGASADAIGVAAAFRVLARPLVLRGEWALRKMARVRRAPEVFETWLDSSATSMSVGP